MVVDTRQIVSRIEALLDGALRDMGKELVLVEYRRESNGWILRLYVDRLDKPGITVDELVEVSHMMGPLLEVEEVLSVPFRLEVSSPGLDRPIGRLADCERFAGKAAEICIREPIQGRKNFSGILKGIDESNVLLEEGAALHRIPWELVRKARLKE